MPKKSLKKSSSRPKPLDALAELHALRHEMAARFDFDDARLIAWVNSLPLPPGSRVLRIKARKPAR